VKYSPLPWLVPEVTGVDKSSGLISVSKGLRSDLEMSSRASWSLAVSELNRTVSRWSRERTKDL
jgi:hypothetical protein